MDKLRLWLGGLLMLQLLLAALLLLAESRSGPSGHEPGPLLNFDKGQIDKIMINSDSDEVTMRMDENHWSLPGLDGLSVNRSKLDAMLEKLAKLQTNWPVATTADSHQRFDVSEEKFQRRLRLYRNEEQIGELFLGSSPGFRKTHVRAAGEDEVYAVALNTYDFPAKNDGWMDKTLLAAGDVVEIKGADYVLKKSGDQWTLSDENGDAITGEPDLDKAKRLSEALSSLIVTGVAEEKPDFTSDEVVSLDVSGTESRRYQFLRKDDEYYLRRDDGARVFTLSQYDYDSLAGVRLADLTLRETEETAAGKSGS